MVWLRPGQPDGDPRLARVPVAPGRARPDEKRSLRPGVALRRDEFLTRPEACTIVAEFMVKTGLLSYFQAVNPTASGVEEEDEE